MIVVRQIRPETVAVLALSCINFVLVSIGLLKRTVVETDVPLSKIDKLIVSGALALSLLLASEFLYLFFAAQWLFEWSLGGIWVAKTIILIGWVLSAGAFVLSFFENGFRGAVTVFVSVTGWICWVLSLIAINVRA